MVMPQDREAHFIARPLERCPECRSSSLKPVVESGFDPTVHFLCQDCARCWSIEHGAYSRVSPRTCAGCSQRERCEEAYAADRRL